MSACNHADTYLLPDPWPSGDPIEVCNCCGMSRAYFGYGVSPWLRVDLYRSRKETQATVDRILRSVRQPLRRRP